MFPEALTELRESPSCGKRLPPSTRRSRSRRSPSCGKRLPPSTRRSRSRRSPSCGKRLPPSTRRPRSRSRSPFPRNDGEAQQTKPRQRSMSSDRSLNMNWRKRADSDGARQQGGGVGAGCGEDPSQVATAIIDGIPRSSGEPTWRAEVTVPREGAAGPLGKRGTTAIRGPNRISKELAQEDVEQLVHAYKDGGSNEIRRVQRELNRSWVKK
eukprot:TRINITY_DN16784_c0_g1_i5.p1 TRINITY_DN16784_c0_g1~~TRINITY_DN16784_c0_g1_i5.p1  ORF type:complete len:211 (+),score=23.44 TRINITY_DN16784_c0_g1_i5:327-959(+)